jgi:hypothetical protein
MIWYRLGISPVVAKWNSPGSSLRWAKSRSANSGRNADHRDQVMTAHSDGT